MKKIRNYCTMAMLIALGFACKKEKVETKEETKIEQAGFLGQWNTASQVSRNYTNGNFNYTDNGIVISSMTFNEGNTGSYVGTGGSTNFTWSLSGNRVELTLCESFSGFNFCNTYKILENTSNSLKLFTWKLENNNTDSTATEINLIK